MYSTPHQITVNSQPTLVRRMQTETPSGTHAMEMETVMVSCYLVHNLLYLRVLNGIEKSLISSVSHIRINQFNFYFADEKSGLSNTVKNIFVFLIIYSCLDHLVET